MPRTDFIETEALLIALDIVIDDVDEKKLENYLRDNFLPGELRNLELAANELAAAAGNARR